MIKLNSVQANKQCSPTPVCLQGHKDNIFFIFSEKVPSNWLVVLIIMFVDLMKKISVCTKVESTYVYRFDYL